MTYFDSKIDHISFKVPNLEEAVEFYTTVMGFKITNKFFGNGMEFVFITDGNITYEVVEDKSLTKTNIDHIAYVTEDIRADYEHFQEMDLITLPLKKLDFMFENGMEIFFIKGPCDQRIEFVQRL